MALLEVGHIAKPHGLKGEVIVDLSTDRLERLAPGTTLQTDHGALTVRHSQPHQHRWIVAFEGVADRDAADALRGTILRAEPIEDADTLWVHELIGSDVHDVTGRRLGKVTEVEANPASDLLVLEDGALIPLRFVVEQSDNGLVVDIPEGLIE
jgi:16S rRNA processing protein RimM